MKVSKKESPFAGICFQVPCYEFWGGLTLHIYIYKDDNLDIYIYLCTLYM